MPLLALVAVLASVPSVGSLVEAGHHGHHSLGSGGNGLPDPSWLLDDAGKAWVAVELLTRAELLLEIDHLQARMPGMGGVAALVTSGIVLVLVGVGFTIAGLVQVAVTGMVTWVLGVGLGALGIGVVLLILAVVDSVAILETRNRYDYRLARLRDQLGKVTQLQVGPSPTLTLARF